MPTSCTSSTESCEMFDIDEWKVEFETDVNKCGEKLQWHECQAVAINMGMRTNAVLTFLMKLLNSLHLMKKPIL